MLKRIYKTKAIKRARYHSNNNRQFVIQTTFYTPYVILFDENCKKCRNNVSLIFNISK